MYIQKNEKTDENAEWVPELTYYIGLVRRLVDSELMEFKKK